MKTMRRKIKSILDPLLGESRFSFERKGVRYYCTILLTVRYRGYYTVARRYEFYVRVARPISHSFASLTREILFLLATRT